MGVHRLHQLAKAGKLTIPAMNVNGCVTKVSMSRRLTRERILRAFLLTRDRLHIHCAYRCVY